MKSICKKTIVLVLILTLIISIVVFGQEEMAACTDKDYDIVIVGAGIAGLTSGYLLKDEDILILERNNYVGGRTLGEKYGSFTYTKGTEYLGKPTDIFKKIIKQLDLKSLEIPSPMDAHFSEEGEFFLGEYELAQHCIEKSSEEEFTRFVNTVKKTYKKLFPKYWRTGKMTDEMIRLDNMTSREWFIENNFSQVLQDRYNVTAKGVFGASIDEISAFTFIPEIAFDYEGTKLKKLLNKKKYRNTEKGAYSTASYSFMTGISDVTNKMAEVLRDKVQLNSNVIRIEKKGDKYRVYYLNGQNKKQFVTANKVILSVPASEAFKIAGEILDDELVALLEQVPYTTYATVAFFSNEPIWDKSFDLAMPDSFFFTDLYDSTWVERYYKNMNDVEEYISSAYVAPQSYKDNYLITMSDEELLENIYEDLEKAFPGCTEKITGYDIHRFPHAYPVFTPGAHQRLERMKELNEGDILLTGDFMSYPVYEDTIDQVYYEVIPKVEEYLNNK